MNFTCLSGNTVDFTTSESIRASRVNISDICHGLALVNRFAGQTPEPYSVAQHSLLVANLMFQECVDPDPYTAVGVKIVGLLHDAHEAFTSDIPMPVKGRLGNVSLLEEALDEMILASFRLPTDLLQEYPNLRKRSDERAREIECKVLRKGLGDERLVRVMPWHEARDVYANALMDTLKEYRALVTPPAPPEWAASMAKLLDPFDYVAYLGYPANDWAKALQSLQRMSGRKNPREAALYAEANLSNLRVNSEKRVVALEKVVSDQYNTILDLKTKAAAAHKALA